MIDQQSGKKNETKQKRIAHDDEDNTKTKQKQHETRRAELNRTEPNQMDTMQSAVKRSELKQIHNETGWNGNRQELKKDRNEKEMHKHRHN